MGSPIVVRPPSALARASLSLLLLAGFYATILAVAALLFALPVGVFVILMRAGRFDIRLLFLVALCWLPAGLLLASVFTTRRPKFVPPRRRLTEAEAPELFAMVAELEARAGTPGPDAIYLEPVPVLAVAETGGVLRSHRVLILGVPLLHVLTVDELRAAIAHELGHFAGGDTRLTALTLHTHALFASVVRRTERDPFRVGTQHVAIESGFAAAHVLGRALVGAYGRLYFRLTRPIERRQELAADALSAALVTSAVTASALEKAHVATPLYERYLQDDVGFAVLRGAMPTDLREGFLRLRDRFLDTDEGRAFTAHVRTVATDPYDTHPALAERLRALEERADSSGGSADVRSATTLWADPSRLEAWLQEATLERVLAAIAASGRSVGAVRVRPWASIPEDVYAPAAFESARRAAERLHPLFPRAATLGAMFAEVWRGLEAGRVGELAVRVSPALLHVSQSEGERVALRECADLLTTLLQGALLERGATIEDSLGEAGLVMRLGSERVSATEELQRLARDEAGGRAALEGWARRLEVPPVE
jgi:Zn-dependent protease with chaperone function